MLHFQATIEVIGINPYVLVSKQRAEALKPEWRKPMPVLVQVNGQPKPAWHINMMPVGDGSFYLYLHGQVRQASHTSVGDRVKVDVQFDADYKGGPTGPIPPWFSEPLAANPTAFAAWTTLPPSRKKEILRYLTHLKSDTARVRNVQRAIAALSGDTTRFMARKWKDGK